jgi:hypothetical protein
MSNNEIIAALLTIALNSSKHRDTGADHRDQVIHDYEYFLKRMQDKDAESIPPAMKPLVEEVKRRQEERQKNS